MALFFFHVVIACCALFGASSAVQLRVGSIQDAHGIGVDDAASAADSSLGAAVLGDLTSLLARRQVDKLDTHETGKLAWVLVITSLSESTVEQIRVLRDSLVAVAEPGHEYATGRAAFVAVVPRSLGGDQEPPPSAECLHGLGFDEVVQVAPIRPCPKRDPGFFTSLFARLNIWNLTQYDRIVSLDTDMLVLQNIDELFEYTDFAAAHDWPRGSLQKACRCVSKACRGEVPGLLKTFEYVKEPHYINTGLMVVTPNRTEYEKMATYLTQWNLRVEDAYDKESCQPSEQRFIGDYFNTEEGGDGWFPLAAEVYNARLSLMQSAPQAVRDPKILHYAGNKPSTHIKRSRNALEEWFFDAWFKQNQSSTAMAPALPASCGDLGAPQKPRSPAGAVEIADYLGQLSDADRNARELKCGSSLNPLP